ncbi:acyl-CoA dehydrogenase family protein [Gordonia polyisoprenivorans]|uniref:acyl-CoA dehydrogenase family protein n=1 Tax=Gordonia polyisoprenivorans TaxID=84595 RepID=UPI001AD70C03|nr:acyl-CoA dehydrogenase family protein [Gordonia polyisoprenivorans]QTI69935.1 acyl-CoA/acyl-ACP dehydrogenase [Gordonia polyisoprenivorans]
MKFSLTSEQEGLTQVLSDYLDARAPLTATRALLEAGTAFDRDVWARMAAELGVQGVDVPESLDGTGMSTVELSLVMHEAGRRLYSGPLLASTGLALSLLLAVDDPGDEVRSSIADLCGGHIVVAAVPDAGGAWAASEVATTATDGTTGWTLTGVKRLVLQADVADTLLIAAVLPDGTTGLFTVDPAAAAVTADDSIDPTRTLCTVELAHSQAQLIVRDADDVFARGALRASVALAGESLGSARQALESAAAYATDRRQFGQPIGAFQGVKHRLADALVDIELATSAVYLAACHVEADDRPQALASVPMAVRAATDALTRVARDAVQVHGGVGFTWEYDPHLFVKRGRVSRELLGSPAERLDALYTHGPKLARSS